MARLHEKGEHPKSNSIPWITWAQGAEHLKEILLKGDWYTTISARASRPEGKKKRGGTMSESSASALKRVLHLRSSRPALHSPV